MQIHSSSIIITTQRRPSDNHPDPTMKTTTTTLQTTSQHLPKQHASPHECIYTLKMRERITREMC